MTQRSANVGLVGVLLCYWGYACALGHSMVIAGAGGARAHHRPRPHARAGCLERGRAIGCRRQRQRQAEAHRTAWAGGVAGAPQPERLAMLARVGERRVRAPSAGRHVGRQ
eukprot:gene15233-21368_t